VPQTPPKHNFDIDLDFGQVWERRIVSMFEGEGSIEVKADRKWWEWGNLVFEIEYNGKPSGVAASEAVWWVSVLTNKEDPHQSDMILIWKTANLLAQLKELVKTEKADICWGGDGKRAKLVRVMIDKLIPQVIHDKPWSLMKEAFDEGVQKGRQDVINNPKIYGISTDT
jgi:hypothetical protein